MQINVQFADGVADVPDAADIRAWARRALRSSDAHAELTVRVVDAAEGRELNERWRSGSGPTNVLAFPLGDDCHVPHVLGDIVVCAPVAAEEARRDGKALTAHWAHLVVHGTLHLAGYDHINEEDANEMEAMERKILGELGYPDPY